jgi:hypothetical protein
MGVAVGRVRSKAGLRVQNFNKDTATLKHHSCVYDFYNTMNVLNSLWMTCLAAKLTLQQQKVIFLYLQHQTWLMIYPRRMKMTSTLKLICHSFKIPMKCKSSYWLMKSSFLSCVPVNCYMLTDTG